MPTALTAPAAIGLATTDPGAVHALILNGLPYAALNKFHKCSGLAFDLTAEIVRIPKRTLARRRAAKVLDPDESDRLYRLAQLFARATELFGGDTAAAREWLSNPVRALGNRKPLDLAHTAVGSQMVLDVIGRLEHGVFT